jgi:hypothetical protein
MIRHHEKVKRSLQPRPNTITGNYGLTFGEPVSIIRTEFVPKHTRISRETCMAMGVTKKHLVGVFQINERGILCIFVREGMGQLSRLSR